MLAALPSHPVSLIPAARHVLEEPLSSPDPPAACTASSEAENSDTVPEGREAPPQGGDVRNEDEDDASEPGGEDGEETAEDSEADQDAASEEEKLSQDSNEEPALKEPVVEDKDIIEVHLNAPLSKLLIKDLRRLCREKGLPTGGSKQECLERLQKTD